MIISRKHKYLFVELPRTGTTAIAHELVENYDGESILSKHATYDDFLKNYRDDAHEYFVFSCRRNPIDRLYSYFVKMKNGYYDYKYEEKQSVYERLYLMPTVKWIKKNNPNFSEFLRKKYRLPYCDWSVLDHEHFDFIIDFEALNVGFKEALVQVGIQPIRDLPKKNVTNERVDLSFIIEEIDSREISRLFGPFFLDKKWNINEWDINIHLKKSDLIKYKIVKNVYSIYWRFIK